MSKTEPGISSLAVDQRAVLQAIYDHFHEYGSWPVYGHIRGKSRKRDSAAIVQGIPRSLLRQPTNRNGKLNPADTLRLTLSGITACEGSSEDTERLVTLLRWLAEVASRGPGRISTIDGAKFLGFANADELPLLRLLNILAFDLSEEDLEVQVLELYRDTRVILHDGESLRIGSDDAVRIIQTGLPCDRLQSRVGALVRNEGRNMWATWGLVDLSGMDVTGSFISQAERQPRPQSFGLTGRPPIPVPRCHT